MSGLKKISGDDLKAPTGQFRIIATHCAGSGGIEGTDHYLVGDYASIDLAIEVWRPFHQKNRDPDVDFLIHNDAGREFGVLGMKLQASAGHFRVVCIDEVPTTRGEPITLWLRLDTDDRTAALAFAKDDDQGPHADTRVYDDTGAQLKRPLY